ncbi:polysaccharide biosynthesis/export family protein [Paenirhodobacter populi]|uniref:Polysaccharide export protein n=1 Tax=Paenirhodobacter populi TaxID=2306993 RepID=A0A443JCC7_9RHOB|nr:polysaccharide biosynthesis/export family protein [Sinirhodobacter populi]RWR18003.1 polysaccharide export protein [Sinirhodobacter populi]
MSRIKSLIIAVAMLLAPQLATAYVITPGDTLQVDVLEDPSLSRAVLVLPDGSVNFPGAGSISVGGKSPVAAQDLIANRLASEFAAKPSVYVSVAGLSPSSQKDLLEKPKNIYIMGEINKPGIVEAEQGITLLQAIAQAGGFTRFAATKRVELHRPDLRAGTERVFIFDYRTGKGISGATPLLKGDVIVIPERRLFE